MRGLTTKIKNIVLSITYEDTEFNLEEAAKLLDDTVYKPKRFPGIVYKLEHPRASFLIFSTGKVVCAEVSSMNDANRAIRELTRKLSEVHIKVKTEPKVKVQNIVVYVDLVRKLDLEHMARNFENTEYEPKVFPGMVFRLEYPKVVFLLFASGKCVCVWAKSMYEIKIGAQKLIKIIRRY